MNLHWGQQVKVNAVLEKDTAPWRRGHSSFASGFSHSRMYDTSIAKTSHICQHLGAMIRVHEIT